MTLLPTKVLPYAKAWISLIAAIVTTVVATLPHVPSWLTVIPAILGTIGVYLTPNADPAATHQDESVQPPSPRHADNGDGITDNAGLEALPASIPAGDTKADATFTG